jgi:putative ABC transport system substrate-binding protein
VRRRDFIKVVAASAAWPLAARAQQGERMRRIGVLFSGAVDDSETKTFLAAFRQGLEQLGGTEGRNLQIDARFGQGDADRSQICCGIGCAHTGRYSDSWFCSHGAND